MESEVKNNDNNDVVYFTQKELAKRWRITQATVKSIRDRGEIPYFFPPNSSRVLYPREEILTIEQEQLISTNKEKRQQNKYCKSKMKLPVVSVQSTKEWRI
ncbi:MAG TPA: DNA-binding protein [Desulfocapsa sulfexigens]|nr:DNA-binding protein [Desulfocapsa sulfexigens]